MGDLLDFTSPRKNATMTGYYYNGRPNNPDDEHELFFYEKIDPNSKTWRLLQSNILNNTGTTTTIRVHKNIHVDIDNGYILLQDGRLYKIDEDMEDTSTANAEVFRMFQKNPNITHLLRLTEVSAPWLHYENYT